MHDTTGGPTARQQDDSRYIWQRGRPAHLKQLDAVVDLGEADEEVSLEATQHRRVHVLQAVRGADHEHTGRLALKLGQRDEQLRLQAAVAHLRMAWRAMGAPRTVTRQMRWR